jgi:glutathione S-transferase
VTEAERWAEAELQPSPRRIFRWAAVRQHELRVWLNRQSGIPAPALNARLSLPLAKRFANKVGASDEGVREEMRRLPERLDRVDALLADGLIGGEELNAADLQIGCSIRVFLTFPQLVPLLAGRPAEAHARRVHPNAVGPVPLRIPVEWLPA